MKPTLTLLTALLLAPLAGLHAAELHVAPTGNDANPGTKMMPLRTIQAAADRLQPGDTCVVHAGNYRESVVMKQSGTASAPIMFRAATGEKAVIDSTEMLNLKWEKFKGNIYRAATKESFRQLFFDGAMMLEARWPNMASMDDVWKESRWAVAGRGSEYGKVVDPELAATGINMTGATAVLNVYHQFYTWTRPVKEHKAGSDSFIYEKDLKGVKEREDETGANLTLSFTDDRYYLLGKLELLDAPGEWFLDAKEGMLYFYAPDGIDPTGHTIIVKQRDYGFTAKKQNFLHFDGLTFFGCGINLEDCNDCLFENSTVLYSSCTEKELLAAGDPDINLADLHPTITGDRNVIRNNLFAYGTQTGLFVDGDDDVIENNIFHDLCWLASLSHVALCFTHSWTKPAPGSRCLIRYNTLYNAGGPLLHFNGRNNLIEYNDLYHGMRAAFGGNKDVAILYTGGDVVGSKVRCNWVHDSAGGSTANKWGNGMGMRGDDNTIGLTFARNVIWNVGACSIMMKNVGDPAPEQANAVFNNTTFDNSTMLLGNSKVDIILSMGKLKDGGHCQNRLTPLLNNAANMLSAGWGQKPLPESSLISHNFVSEKLPLMDPKNGDFRPAPGSPLIGAGIAVPGHSAPFVGKAPDIGAYEAGAAEYWIPGHRTAAASRPIIPDQAKDIRLNADLIWLQGYQSKSSDVYFGTSKTAVESATRSSKEFRGSQKGNIFNPGALAPGTEYFWRTDAVGGENKTIKGAVWSFRTKP